MNKFYILIWYILIILVVVLSELLGRLFAWGGLFVSPLVSLVIALWIQDQFSTAITAAGFGEKLLQPQEGVAPQLNFYFH